MTDQDPVGPLRILHVFSTFSVGGPQIRFNQLAGEPDRSVEHVVFAMDGRYDCLDLLSEAANVTRSDLQPRTSLLPGRLRQYRQELVRMRPDRLITYNWGAIEWAAANWFPLCSHIHVEDGFGTEEAEGQIRRRVFLRRLVLSRHSRVVMPSRTLFCIARDVWRLPEARLQYIPNGIDLSPYGTVSEAAAKEMYGLPQDKLIIGTLATLRPEKNLMRLIEAFQKVGAQIDCHLVIAGDGRERAALENRSRDLGLEDAVSFPGFIEMPHTILPALDVFAISSDTEQMPLSIMEAMAAGLPIASLDVGDVREMVASEGREFVKGKEAEDLVGSLSRLLGNAELRQLIGDANRKLAKSEFDITKMLASWKNLFIYG